jgi:hypothetical protein
MRPEGVAHGVGAGEVHGEGVWERHGVREGEGVPPEDADRLEDTVALRQSVSEGEE